jgi:hypothetical protein
MTSRREPPRPADPAQPFGHLTPCLLQEAPHLPVTPPEPAGASLATVDMFGRFRFGARGRSQRDHATATCPGD